MSIIGDGIKRLFGLRDSDVLQEIYTTENAAGENVSDATVMSLSAFWACVYTTASVMASTSLMMYRRGPDGLGVPYKKHLLYHVTSVQPNTKVSAFTFWQGIIAWMLVRGNGYALKKYSPVDGRIVSLILLPSNCVEVVEKDGRVIYEYRPGDHRKNDDYAEKDVFHLRGFDVGGLSGMSVIEHGAQSLGLSLASEKTAAKMFAQGMSASGLLSTENTVLTPEQRKDLQGIMNKFSGSKNAGKTMVLEGGLKFQAMTLKPADAELLSTRRFNVEDICRWFLMPPIIIGHSGEGQTMWGTGVEQIMIAWRTLGLNPLMTNIEKALGVQLLTPTEQSRFYFEFTREGLMQADSKSKGEFLTRMTQGGMMTRDEARAKLNLPPMGGNAAVLTVQSQNIPIDEVEDDEKPNEA